MGQNVLLERKGRTRAEREPQLGATPGENAKYDEYLATMKQAGIEPKSSDAWRKQYREVQGRKAPENAPESSPATSLTNVVPGIAS